MFIYRNYQIKSAFQTWLSLIMPTLSVMISIMSKMPIYINKNNFTRVQTTELRNKSI